MCKLRRLCFALAIVLTTSISAQAKDVTLVGEVVGIKIYTDGLVITDTTEVTTIQGKNVNVAKGYGVEKGDIIKKINGSPAISAATISNALKENNTITLTIERKIGRASCRERV